MTSRYSVVIVCVLCCSVVIAEPFSQLMNSDLFVTPPKTARSMLALIKAEPTTSFNPVTFMATLSTANAFSQFVPQIRIATFCPYRDDDSVTFPSINTYSCANAPASATRTLIIIETPGGFTQDVTDQDDKWKLVSVSDVFQGSSTTGGLLGTSSSTTAAIGAIVIILFVVLVIVGICVCRRKMQADPSDPQGNVASSTQRSTTIRRRQLPQLRDPEIQYAPVPRPGTTSTDVVRSNNTREGEDTVEMGPVAGRVLSSPSTAAAGSMRAAAARAAAAAATRATAAPEPEFASVVPSTSLFHTNDAGGEAPRASHADDESKVGAMDLWAP